MTFAETIRPILEREGISYSEVGRQMQRSRQWVGRVAAGVVVPKNPDTIQELATVLTLDPDVLFRAAGVIPPDIEHWILTTGPAMRQVRTLMEES